MYTTLYIHCTSIHIMHMHAELAKGKSYAHCMHSADMTL